MISTGFRAQSVVRTYAVLVCGVTLTVLLASGLSDMYFAYREAREQISALQASQALSAAREISQYLQSIQLALGDSAKLPWGSPGYGLEERREEFHRLMQATPAITDLQVVDANGREHLFVSKQEVDRIDSLRTIDGAAPLSVSTQTLFHFSGTFFPDGLSPSLHLAAWDGVGEIVATVDLRLLGDIVSRIRAGTRGRAWIVDDHNVLIAHPQPTNVLRRLDLSNFDAVRFARQARWNDSETVGAHDTIDLEGQDVLVTAARVAGPNWLVFVEQPRAEALKPALATLRRTMLLLLAGGLLALCIGSLFAKRMAAPVQDLRRATGRIASGDLDFRIEVRGSSEVEELARDFNGMATKLRESYAGLEAKVAARTAELSEARDRVEIQAGEVAELNAQLVEQVDELDRRRNEAERANAAKSRFLATASHDLRQPMHSIGLLVDALRDRLGDAPLAQLAAKVQISVATMENLFGSLLDISKLDAGVVRPTITSVDLSRLISRVQLTFAPEAQARGLRLRIREAPVSVLSDSVLLERILNNLVANAIRYTSDGGVLVACRRRGDSCVVQIWDTGPGIAAENLVLVFEEFVRLDLPGATSDRGLGLGLSIVDRSARLLGHALNVRSRLGRGSVFELTVGLAQEEHPSYSDPIALPGTEALAGAFVVVVDDDAGNRAATRDVLQGWNCLILEAASCEELIELSAKHMRAPDFIVTDLQLGSGIDGFELIDRVRSFYEAHIPAIVVTANTAGDLAVRALQADAVLLHKPAGSARLLGALLQALQAHAVGGKPTG